MNKKHTAQSAFFNLRILIALLLCAVAACSLVSRPLLAFFRPEASTKDSQRSLTFAQRVVCQRAIEEVYWRHRIWPKDRPDPKPPLDAVMSQAQLENKVADYLLKSQAVEDHWQRPISAEQLQTQMERMAKHTKQPDVLREIFDALGNDPFIIAECVAKPVLCERLITNFYAQDQRFHRELRPRAESWKGTANNQAPKIMAAASANYALPTISDTTTGCTPDTWTNTSTTNAPDARYLHTAVWTGSEMIVWGGVFYDGSYHPLNTGGTYNPSTDSWIATSTTNAPEARAAHTAVWTGSEMIVWGGEDSNFNGLNTGGRYNPSTDSWVATSTTNAPEARDGHTAVWANTTGEMIVWGGGTELNTGGRYNPGTDTWAPTSTTNAPSARFRHTVVWTGSEMIVWGGVDSSGHDTNTGGKYDPGTDSWTPTSTTNAPIGREYPTAVWTGNEMIVWGGDNDSGNVGTGGRYDPGTDSWIATSIGPSGRFYHTAVWTGSEMIIWGGYRVGMVLGTGKRYNPSTDSWIDTTTNNAPAARELHTAVWTGNEMIVWGGLGDFWLQVNTGGRYCAQSGAPTPTPTPTGTATPTATATQTPRPTPTPRSAPTSRPRPTPVPRP